MHDFLDFEQEIEFKIQRQHQNLKSNYGPIDNQINFVESVKRKGKFSIAANLNGEC